ncbi:hypothetical protein KP509_39G028400 [Ceratopteris richardii]|uniref:JmjC domain-containing protein n=1 Tax=Ceratopteris richardii TaxID=49495 RepID=A0A8T2Q023_CERRI|nr:hypothetical protein KP509_39G028400 [Ceratopteris richardii]
MEEQQVVEQVRCLGGFEYVKLAEKAAKGDEFAAEAAHEMAWEQLHCGPWHDVDHAWRDAYALSCLRLAAHRIHDALRLLDMGLLMGGPLLKPHLQSAIAELHIEHQQHQQQRELPGENVLRSERLHDPSLAERDINPSAHVFNSIVECGTVKCNEAVSSMVCLRSEHQNKLQAATSCNRLSQVQDITLPHGSLSHEIVCKKSLISMEDFLCNHFISDLPVIITDAITHWPAMDRWKDLDYFKSTFGHRTVPVEVGEHYLASGWKQELMSMDELIQRFESSTGCPSERPYLAQHPLFEQIPELREDIVIPDYCVATGGEIKAVNAWFGPSGTVTPLHHDPHHNLLTQVVGKKYVRLYNPAESCGLYPFSESMLSNSSQIDLDNPDYVKFPLAEQLPYMDCILEQGEMLYIPPKWWHYVKSLTLSFSVSFWWSAMEE